MGLVVIAFGATSLDVGMCEIYAGHSIEPWECGDSPGEILKKRPACSVYPFMSIRREHRVWYGVIEVPSQIER